MRKGPSFLTVKMRQRKAPRTLIEHNPTQRPQRGPAKPAARPGSGASGGDEWVYGRHAALALIANPQRQIRQVITVTEHAPWVAAALAGRADDALAPTLVDARALAAALPEGAVHQGVAVLAAPLPSIHLDELIAAADPVQASIVVLDQATDPRNVGAVLRAAAAFGATGVVVQDRHAPSASSALAKAASGALERVPLVRVVNIARALRTLQDAGFWCLGFAGDGSTSIDAARLDGRLALVLGAEDSGLRRLVRESCDDIVHIPISAAVESLNLATAAAVALYEVSRRARLSPLKSRY